MSKYHQQKEDGIEASRQEEESFEGNNTVHKDIPESKFHIVLASATSDMEWKREMPSRAVLSESEGDASEEQLVRNPVGVQEHSTDMNTLVKEAYRLIKENASEQAWRDKENETNIFRLKTLLGDTVLHMAAAASNGSHCVGAVAEKAPQLLTAKNSNDNTPLHVAAGAGNIHFLEKLFNVESFQEPLNEILQAQNNQGNTFIHEALLKRRETVMHFLFSEEMALPEASTQRVLPAALFRIMNNQGKSILYLAIEAGFKEVVEKLITRFPGYDEEEPYVPSEKSPFLAAIMEPKREILELLMSKVPRTCLRDPKGRTPLHCAASKGYLDVVKYLLTECAWFAFQRDDYGYYPLHLASDGGHVQVVHELLKKEHCPDPRELLDLSGRNFLHLAVSNGKLSVLRYVLKSKDSDLVKMINDKDDYGNTLLHLATLRCHPRIVHALTWDKRVEVLKLVNGKNQTALDLCKQTSQQNLSYCQRLTWLALKSAGVPYADPFANSIKVPSQTTETLWEMEPPEMAPYKDRINTLILVTTLIVTVTFAAGFTLPGGAKSSDPGQGMANMLHRMWFKLFVFCITISMYGAVSATIILIWAQLGDLTVAIIALHVAKYCLGVTLTTLSLAFLAGVHLVISDLNWLATSALVMSVTFILMLLILYILLWLPSKSNNRIMRWISYYPFRMLASLVETKDNNYH